MKKVLVLIFLSCFVKRLYSSTSNALNSAPVSELSSFYLSYGIMSAALFAEIIKALFTSQNKGHLISTFEQLQNLNIKTGSKFESPKTERDLYLDLLTEAKKLVIKVAKDNDASSVDGVEMIYAVEAFIETGIGKELVTDFLKPLIQFRPNEVVEFLTSKINNLASKQPTDVEGFESVGIQIIFGLSSKIALSISRAEVDDAKKELFLRVAQGFARAQRAEAEKSGKTPLKSTVVLDDPKAIEEEVEMVQPVTEKEVKEGQDYIFQIDTETSAPLNEITLFKLDNNDIGLFFVELGTEYYQLTLAKFNELLFELEFVDLNDNIQPFEDYHVFFEQVFGIQRTLSESELAIALFKLHGRLKKSQIKSAVEVKEDPIVISPKSGTGDIGGGDNDDGDEGDEAFLKVKMY